MINVLFIALIAGSAAAFLIVRFSHLHLHVTSDTAFGEGPQKFHHETTPRIGGVAIIIGLLVGLLIAVQNEIMSAKQCWPWLLCMAPVFLVGLGEDLSKKVAARWRLLAAFTAAVLGWFLLDGKLSPPGAVGLADQPFYPVLCFVFTLFAVSGVTHAFNIIDGLNGLLGGTAVLTVSALAWMSHKVGDPELLVVCLSLLGGVMGFLVFNFPFGKLFAGDAGAYLIGFLIAEISVLLTVRHPEVSPWFPMLLVVYPVTEVLFSVYRRSFLKRQAADQPDALHLHSILYKRIAIWIWKDTPAAQAKTLSNSFAAAVVWFLMLPPLGFGILFYDQDLLLIGGGALFALCYISLYWGVVRFKTPKHMLWLKAVCQNRLE